ncbi:aldehyde dehydrogenase family protein, partial [Escherichia coli]|uniref:aldehyde dehydrogenase family protein n=1 Tax=Escherichia coli TaxID=562 RepID=UPI00200E3C34
AAETACSGAKRLGRPGTRDCFLVTITKLVDRKLKQFCNACYIINQGVLMHAAFGGYKQSGIGRETHKMMLEHYQQTKCLLVSYSDKPLGLF